MRIAILGSRGYPSTYGGFETLVRHLAPHLAEAGHNVAVYARETAAGAADRRVEVIRTAGWESKSFSTLTYGATAALHAAVRRPPDAALILNVANGFFLPALAARGIRTVVNVDGLEWDRDKWSRAGKAVFRAGARMTARYGDTLVYDSRAIRPHWRDAWGRDGEFIPYGANLPVDASSDRLAEHGLAEDSFLLVVARLVPENNIALILDAHKASGTELPLVVVGSGTYDDALQHRLANTAGTGRVRWFGHVSDQELLGQLWAHCRLYLHGHSVGGTNPGLLQAMAHGAAIQALDTVYNREVLLDDDFLFPADAGRLASKLRGLVGDAQRRQELRERALRRVKAAYGWAEVLDRYEEVLVRSTEQRKGEHARLW